VKHLLPVLLLFAALTPLWSQVDDALRQQVETIIKDFDRKDYEAVIAGVESIDATDENAAFLENLRGAAHTKMKDYPAAKAAFEKALELSPGMFAANFNLGELLFLQKEYEPALTWFRRMLINDPRNELLQFKVFLCYLQMGDESEAEKALDAIRYPGDTPAWYYARAAWEFSQDNKNRARDYLAGARYIFPERTEIFDETFMDLGLPTR
jgi:tetratricopeptide (TPR) repeat protein